MGCGVQRCSCDGLRTIHRKEVEVFRNKFCSQEFEAGPELTLDDGRKECIIVELFENEKNAWQGCG